MTLSAPFTARVVEYLEQHLVEVRAEQTKLIKLMRDICYPIDENSWEESSEGESA